MSRSATLSDVEEIRQTAIKYLLDTYGRNTYGTGTLGMSESEVVPFHVYHPSLVPSYERIVNDKMRDMLKRQKLFQDGFDAIGEILPEEVYESITGYELPQVMRFRAEELGVVFEQPDTDELVKMLKEAQEASVELYHESARNSERLQDIVSTNYYPNSHDDLDVSLRLLNLIQLPDSLERDEYFERMIKERKQLVGYRLMKKKETPDVSLLDVLNLIRSQGVLFLHAPCGTGKSTRIEEIRALIEGYFLLGFDDSGLIRKPLVNFWVIDSGKFLKEDGFITPEDVMESLAQNLDEFRYALKQLGPIAVVDAGDNLGMRLAMYRLVTEIRPHAWIHTTLLTVSELETVVRNQMRLREEYSPDPKLVYRAFESIREYGNGWSKQDFSSLTYPEKYEELYNVQCSHSSISLFDQWSSCDNPSHPPGILCQEFCQKCWIHCPHKRGPETIFNCTMHCRLFSAAAQSSPYLARNTTLLIRMGYCVMSPTLTDSFKRRLIVTRE